MQNRESLYHSVLRGFGETVGLNGNNSQPSGETDLEFAMHSNGYTCDPEGNWKFRAAAIEPLKKEFEGQRVSFFGPPPHTDNFFAPAYINATRLISAFEQLDFLKMIAKYRDIDTDLAARIAFVHGGIARHITTTPNTRVEQAIEQSMKAVRYSAKMTRFGDAKSGDATACAMAMYVISGGSLEDDITFTGNVYHMADAINHDPTEITSTSDLGVSQVARLGVYNGLLKINKGSPVPEIRTLNQEFRDFPTVGAEWHIPVAEANHYPELWRRLALLNMSQHHHGLHIQLSRRDRGVVEIRMNPSNYAVTIADWRHMKLLLNELDHTYFTMTFNRNGQGNDFSWSNRDDTTLLKNVKAIGLLSFASIFGRTSRASQPREIAFGQTYLGQTVRVVDAEKYDFTGLWAGGPEGRGTNGQLGIYAGFGDNFSHLAYYLSMALADPAILKELPSKLLNDTKGLNEAMNTSPDKIKAVFATIQQNVARREKLRTVVRAGGEITKLLSTQG